MNKSRSTIGVVAFIIGLLLIFAYWPLIVVESSKIASDYDSIVLKYYSYDPGDEVSICGEIEN